MAVDADHDFSTLAPKHKALGSVRARGSVREQIKDLEMAIRELVAARDEMVGISEELTKQERRAAMIEPMSRVQLVWKFCGELLGRNGQKLAEVK